MTLEAARAFAGPDVARHGRRRRARSRSSADEVIVCAPEIEEQLVPHGELHVRGRRARGAARRGRVLAGRTPWPRRSAASAFRSPTHERWLVAGAGRDWPTAQEAVLKLREGAYVAAEAHETEQLLHGHLAAVDEHVRAFVLEGEGAPRSGRARPSRRSRRSACDVTLVPTRHPVVDIVPFQLLTVDLAEARGVDPDLIRRDDPRWAKAREAYA